VRQSARDGPRPLHRRRRLLDLPAPDQEPEHEEQFAEEGDKEESKMAVWVEVWLQAIDQPAQSIDYQQNPDDPGDVARAVDQVAEQNEMIAVCRTSGAPEISFRTLTQALRPGLDL
jgi:hypothetical protein